MRHPGAGHALAVPPSSAPTRRPRVRRSDPSGPGWRLRRRGRGFELLDQRGRRIRGTEHRDRVRALAIPPAWKDVWVCPDPQGHVQATGTDAAGRRQYRYHPDHVARRSRAKFDCTARFARSLPDLRARVDADIAGDDRDEATVLACVVRLLDRGFFRVGTETYAAKNRTFGLTTLEKRHVQIAHDDVLVFDYTAKHGRRRVQNVVDARAAEIVGTLRRRRSGGDRLFAHRDATGWHPVRAEAVNAYIREATGLDDVSAKAFRTWNATVLAAVAVSIAEPAAGTSRRAQERVMKRAADEVARYLGNTPAVCRSSYIDPRVFDRWTAGETVAEAVLDLAALPDPGVLATHGSIEAAVLDLLGG
ncbi:DNA topoisomerase IB [Paraconexibacter algicola]|uniref:DNA topoisomerase n=1 Tax=Paraconexibacter algicola TaxID=2133960 RepID=A0A2T4UBR7_9ACTN|nr:DNA topoisomerase IB [Paraconexibacter algicola]PTL54357.1 DNA topoisomerase [Paraconexibacter algicola]